METLLKTTYLIKIQLKLVILFATLLSVILLLFSPFILGLKYLDPLAVAIVLERYVSLIGVLLITPLFFPEQDKNIAELTQVKFISQLKIILMRLILSLIVLFSLVTLMLCIMHYFECEFSFFRYLLFTFVTAMFLGSLGFAGSGITDNIIVGYLLPTTYYILNIGMGSKLGYLYLFSMSVGSYEEKYYLLVVSILLFLSTFLIKHIKNKMR